MLTLLVFGMVLALTGSSVASASPEYRRQAAPQQARLVHRLVQRAIGPDHHSGDVVTHGPVSTPTPRPTTAPAATPATVRASAHSLISAPTTRAPKPTTRVPAPSKSRSWKSPHGPAGTFTATFDDEFSGSSLNRSKWSPVWYDEGGIQNNVRTHASNVAVRGGHLILTLVNSTSGASVNTDPSDVPGGGYLFPVGSCVEARIDFPGNGTTIYNWPAWWASSVDGQYPSSGEHDIAEGLSDLAVSYHSPSGTHTHGAVPGVWSNAFHTYTLCRYARSADVYWDGVLRKHYATDDNVRPEMLILSAGSGHAAANGAQVLVDYVRAWRRG
jgi:hypothetical protein